MIFLLLREIDRLLFCTNWEIEQHRTLLFQRGFFSDVILEICEGHVPAYASTHGLGKVQVKNLQI